MATIIKGLLSQNLPGPGAGRRLNLGPCSSSAASGRCHSQSAPTCRLRRRHRSSLEGWCARTWNEGPGRTESDVSSGTLFSSGLTRRFIVRILSPFLVGTNASRTAVHRHLLPFLHDA